MNNCFIILAAGKSSRFRSKTPKQFSNYKGNLMIEHSLNAAKKSNLFKKVIIVINKNHKNFIKKYKFGKKVKIIIGGRRRQDSSLNALEFLKKKKIKNVFIHDAARPNLTIKLLKKLNRYIKNNNAVVPYIKTDDSVKYRINNKSINLNRKNIYLTQTPQCFNYKYIYKLSKDNNNKITDECSLVIKNNDKIKYINGDLRNIKITRNINEKDNKIFYGIGFDVHRLVIGKKLYLGGLLIKSKYGTLGHSDGDPVLHAITDSILGACKKGDIGEKFPDNNIKFKNIRSTVILNKIIKEASDNNIEINNMDINIITQEPKIKKYKKKMTKLISNICKIEEKKINIKGKTTEKLGLIGKEKAIACEVITSVIKYD